MSNAEPRVPRKRKRPAPPPPPSSLDHHATTTGDSAPVVAPPVSFAQQVVRRAVQSPPQLELLADLMREHGHVQTTSACEHAVAKLVATAKVASAAKPRAKAPAAQLDDLPRHQSAMLREQVHVTAAQRMPGVAELERLRARLVAPVVRVAGVATVPAAADAAHQLRVGALSLPTYTASHESNLLLQSGTFSFVVHSATHTRTFPPCRMGRACVGVLSYRHFVGLDAPIVLMRAMSPPQFERLVRTGEAPPGEAPCVLCHRACVAEYVYYVRALAPHLQHRGVNLPTHEVAQLWCNRFDCPDGYYAAYALHPRPDEVVVAPLCHAVETDLIRAHRVAGQWRLDQSRLLWSAPLMLEPDVGETLRHF